MFCIKTNIHFFVFFASFLHFIVGQGLSITIPSLIDGVAYSRLRATSGALWLHGRHDIERDPSDSQGPIPSSPLVHCRLFPLVFFRVAVSLIVSL
jgi:hypothetical protein